MLTEEHATRYATYAVQSARATEALGQELTHTDWFALYHFPEVLKATGDERRAIIDLLPQAAEAVTKQMLADRATVNNLVEHVRDNLVEHLDDRDAADDMLDLLTTVAAVVQFVRFTGRNIDTEIGENVGLVITASTATIEALVPVSPWHTDAPDEWVTLELL